MKKYYCTTHKQVFDDRYQCIECHTDENNIGNFIEITDGEGAVLRKLDRILALTEDMSKKEPSYQILKLRRSSMTFEQMRQKIKEVIANDPDGHLWTNQELLRFFKWAEEDIRRISKRVEVPNSKVEE